VSERTRLAVTLGDPAGIGPEVVERAAAALLAENTNVELVLVGPTGLVEPMAARLRQRTRPEPVLAFAGPLGEPSAASGKCALAALMRGIDLGRRRAVDAIVTAPLSKHALAMAGSEDRGHTEILARELGAGPTAMAFFSERLHVVLTSTHVPLRHAINGLSAARVVEVTGLLHRALADYLAVASPRLALAGLNPHAGEAGLLGDEEQRVLVPAAEEARDRGFNLSGPHPADTLFYRAASGEFDGVVALYHDQALIPVKLLSFGHAVNVTLGLTVPRTSPDHGTAYDIAGKAKAKPDGMLAALRTAVVLTAPARARARRPTQS
jgi:4-hydroxythreonine-4-phosphate dehydrogenase